MLLNFNISEPAELILDSIHHLGDVLLLTLYPLFVAYALPARILKPLTTVSGRVAVYVTGTIIYAFTMLKHLEQAGSDNEEAVPALIYLSLVVMFVMILVSSLASVKTAKTRLAKEKAIAFVCAFGIRDFAWATVYFVAATGLIAKAEMFFNQLYVGATLVYIPIMAYGILKVQLLDIEIRLKSTIRNTVLAGAFIAFFYLISEGSNNFLSNQLGDVIGFVVSALLTIFLSPLHRWAERFASSLVHADAGDLEYTKSRSHEIYRAAVEEALSYGEVNRGQLALLDRLRDSLNLSQPDATNLELELEFNRAAVAG